MATAFLIALATLLLEDDDLLILFVFEDGDLYRCTFYEWIAEACVRAFADHEDFFDVDRVACFRIRERVNFEDITFSDGELAALCFDSGFHGKNGRANRSERFNQGFFSLFFLLELHPSNLDDLNCFESKGVNGRLHGNLRPEGLQFDGARRWHCRALIAFMLCCLARLSRSVRFVRLGGLFFYEEWGGDKPEGGPD